MGTLPEGILLIDKPVGCTSFDVVRVLRKQLDVRKIGHAGTLDPLASGLLIVGVGPATKLLDRYLKLPKVYDAEVCLGERTTTGDREGTIVEQCAVHGVVSEDVEAVLRSMVGTLELPVPAYSAIKQGGEPLYKKARRGDVVVLPQKPMEVRAATLLAVHERDDRTYVQIRFDVGSGTYVRSLAEELGRRLGYPARLENLRRTQVGEYTVDTATAL